MNVDLREDPDTDQDQDPTVDQEEDTRKYHILLTYIIEDQDQGQVEDTRERETIEVAQEEEEETADQRT